MPPDPHRPRRRAARAARAARTGRTAAGAAVVALAGALALHIASPALAANTTYYVDASAGADSNAGLDSASAWKTLAKVNATTFQPGDRILLRAGQAWTGQLWPKGSGASGAPITIDSYGSGAKPRINGAGQVADAVRLFNQEYWTVRNLEVTNTVPATGTPGANLRDLRGIHVSGDNSQTLDGFVIDAVHVHDVTGQVNWIGGDIADNATGIRFQTGWDGSKKTGGIVFDATVPNISAPPSTPTILNNIRVENSTIANTSFAGIVVKQYTGDGKDSAGNTIATATGWGTRTSATDATFRPHTNVTIRNNYVTQNGTAYGCNGIYLTDVRGALVEYNVIDRTGTSGIETYFADDVTIQFNEVFGTSQKAGGADSNGIDPDKGTTAQRVQYNYVHNNGDGVLLCQFAFGDVILRENVIASNSRYQIYLHSDRAARALIYHNTVYNNNSNNLIYGYGTSLTASYTITNNILYSTRANASLTTSPTIVYNRNLYGGATLTVPSGDTSAVVADPQFVQAPITGPSGTAGSGPQLQSAHALKVRSGSPAINRGVVVSNNGGRDFAGTPLYNGAPDIGAFELPATGATTPPTIPPTTPPTTRPTTAATTPPTTAVTTPPTTVVTTPPTTRATTPTTTQATTPPTGGTGGCTADYKLVGSWGGGFQGEVTVTAGAAPIAGWTVSWTYANGQTLGQIWGATLTGGSGPAISAQNVAWNGSLGAGASTSFGFIGTAGATNTNPVPVCTSR